MMNLGRHGTQVAHDSHINPFIAVRTIRKRGEKKNIGNPILTGSSNEKHASNQLDITSETSEFDKTWVPRGILQGRTVWANVGNCCQQVLYLY